MSIAISPTSPEGKRWLTPDDVAAELGVNRQTVLKWTRLDRLACVRLGHRTVRYTEAQISKFIEESSKRRKR